MDFASNNLTIPRGVIMFAKFATGTQTPGPFRQLGNCPEFTLTRNADTIEHYSSQAGLKTLDDEVAIASSLRGALITDDIKAENVAYFFQGDVGSVTASSLTDQTETYEDTKAGDVYQLGQSDTNPSGHRKVTITTVTDGAESEPATLTSGTDYTVDLDLGLLTMLTDQAKVEVTFSVAASTREQIIASDTQIEGALKFVSYNVKGQQADILIPRARLAPNGDFQLVNDPNSTAYQTMPLTITALKKGNLALAYRDGRAVTS
jgi:hypothetical protein